MRDVPRDTYRGVVGRLLFVFACILVVVFAIGYGLREPGPKPSSPAAYAAVSEAARTLGEAQRTYASCAQVTRCQRRALNQQEETGQELYLALEALRAGASEPCLLAIDGFQRALLRTLEYLPNRRAALGATLPVRRRSADRNRTLVFALNVAAGRVQTACLAR